MIRNYGLIDAAQFEQAVRRALDSGIDCFDTAEAYGMGFPSGRWRGLWGRGGAMSA
jgi:aryl-alcohol dehydrogenase-like predicted oxidoreductase